MTPRGRYAPSPTGMTHLGNASTALLAWLSVRARGGAYVIRMEDLDRPRVVKGSAEGILDDLRWLGLDWDEGPDRGGPFAPYAQSDRGEQYDAAFERLRTEGRVYPCFCSRKDIQSAVSAPQAPGDEARYPGTCRDQSPSEIARRLESGSAPAWRFRVDPAGLLPFTDRVRGLYEADPGAIGDFVVRRSDGVSAYQLAVVVDDIAMRISEVVRGEDLLASTVRQLLLYRALGAPPPAFAHVPLLLGDDGVRLSKRHHGVTLRELRAAGESAEAIVGRLAHRHGLRETAAPISARALVAGFGGHSPFSG
jgi:glutamyl-tRNA synthetase